MGINDLLKEMKGKSIGLDTMCFIYAFENNPTFIGLVEPIFRAIESGGVKAITSIITVTECLVRPMEAGDIALVAKYEAIFRHFPNLYVSSPTLDIARGAAEIRVAYKVRTPDAIQLSTSLHHGVAFFITNDMPIKRIHDVAVVQLNDLLKA